ncbi:M20/M25/M40 family metallo-hydrolase [Aminivibrio sp.]|uniref:M20/M25/M40 family metallo-hydrolase n=1 Tax=Aminivibrio sp. TaxID=1872489 RepID=UPI001A39FF53|nr:M20/M25/M40 family metallo-hydrolase [Aminivibrio sp.]MBL3539857.1 M20/M25/M40 family metallo-hydrolase [Aminivibrio sp.]
MTALVTVFSRLVSIPSTSGREEAACSYLAGVLPSLGWERVETDGAGSVVARRGRGPRELVLLGHIDTVPGGPEHRLEGDVLWGRGTVDAKGPLCAFAASGGRVSLPGDWTVTLVAATGEEADSRGALHRIPRHRPAACIIGEPSGTDGVTIGYRGSLRAVLAASDGGAHRSGNAGPITGVLRCAADILDLVDSLDDPALPVIRRPSGAVVSMEGTEKGERSGTAELDIRLPEGSRPEEWMEFLRAAAGRRGVSITFRGVTPPHVEDKNNPVARALRLAIRKNGNTPRVLAKGGTADFNLASAWNCPMAAYGPGDSKLDHTSEERIPLADFHASVAVLDQALPLILAG